MFLTLHLYAEFTDIPLHLSSDCVLTIIKCNVCQNKIILI